MAELARGRVTDRPWGWTLGALARRGLTGQVDVHSDGRVYSVAFNQGVIFGAASPLPNDAAVRIAMTGGLVSSTQVNDLMRRISGQPGRDEIDLIVEALRLAPEQAQRLRRRVVAQRAARTFSVEDGEFIVHDQFTIGYVPGSELDIRSVVYLGARSNLSDQRLDAELSRMGTHFQLKPEATDDLPYFGFADGDRTLLGRLARGATMSELHAAAPEIDGHTQRAIVYSLVSCAAADAIMARVPSPDDGIDAPTVTRTRTGSGVPPTVTRTPSGSNPAPVVSRTSSATGVPQTVIRTPSGSNPVPVVSRTSSATGVPQMVIRTPSGSTGAPATGRTKSPTAPPPPDDSPVRMRTPTGNPPMQISATPQRTQAKPTTARAKRSTAETRETETLIRQKLIDARGDHFLLLGVARTAPPEEIRTAYFNLARKLHPDRLSSLGITDDNRDAQRLFAQINSAFAVLNDDRARTEYINVMSRGGEAAVREQDAAAEEIAAKVMRAEELFKRGEMALRRDQIAQAMASFAEAVELQPNEVEYQTMLAWTRFASAPDKNAVAKDTRTALQRAADKDQLAVTPRFYLGRVERMLGREREALQYFQAVLAIKPNHAEAASEARVLAQRLKR